MSDKLSTDIKFLKGVGPRKSLILASEVNVRSYRDLLYYFPYKYIDRSFIYNTAQIKPGLSFIQLKGKIINYRIEGKGRKQRIIGTFSDDFGCISLIWFKSLQYIKKLLDPNVVYLIFGKATEFNGSISIVHPEMEVFSEHTISKLGLQPFYNTSEKMKKSSLQSRDISKLMNNLLNVLGDSIEETLPKDLIKEKNFPSLSQALKYIHFPQSLRVQSRVETRLKFEELFYLQLNLLNSSVNERKDERGFVFPKVGDNFNYFYNNNLTFELTNAQKRVIKEIRYDLISGKHMNRLLQGDVGSGKTIVAVICMLLAVDNNYQTCIVAPTEILAEQHFASIKKMLHGTQVSIELLTGKTKTKQRRIIDEGLRSGEIKILIGTHAILEPTVEFNNLGLAIIDEQHRFGVEQRSKLWKKNTISPHILVMTATPIPRTLAMTVYGDLVVSVIDELPPGRKPIKTMHIYEDNAGKLYQLLLSELQMGHQIYYVYPLIKESEKTDYRDVENGFKNVSKLFSDYKVGMLHGKMKPEDKDKAISAFIRNETQILVATTVIEVGVNIPNASIMVIVNADRFGLSQLHQLRGRGGRGAEQSYCALVTKYQIGELVRKRMSIMVESTDGFEIAEEDLKLRGPGDIEGTKQSGIPLDLKIANLVKDGRLLTEARISAKKLLEEDPNHQLEQNRMVWKELSRINSSKKDWSQIS